MLQNRKSNYYRNQPNPELMELIRNEWIDDLRELLVTVTKAEEIL